MTAAARASPSSSAPTDGEHGDEVDAGLAVQEVADDRGRQPGTHDGGGRRPSTRWPPPRCPATTAARPRTRPPRVSGQEETRDERVEAVEDGGSRGDAIGSSARGRAGRTPVAGLAGPERVPRPGRPTRLGAPMAARGRSWRPGATEPVTPARARPRLRRWPSLRGC